MTIPTPGSKDTSPQTQTQMPAQGPTAAFPALPPVDGGKDAWLFLGACFVVEALIWGFPFAFGVFQNFYSTHAPFAGSPHIPIIGTCAMGIMYIDIPLVMGILQRFPHLARWFPLSGLTIMCLSLALSSLSTTVTHLIATQGVLYAIGGSIAYAPCIIYTDQWFVRRKGLAYGVMWSGTGLAGVVLPLLLETLLSRHGFATTLRVFASVIFAATAPLVYFIKPRLPPITHTAHAPTASFAFLRDPQFWYYQAFNVLEATGYFLPAIYLPSYAAAVLGASPTLSALSVLLLNVASVFGCVGMGGLIDRVHVTTCFLISSLGAAAGVFMLWGFSGSLPVLYVFAVVYGVFAGAFSSAWPGIMREVTKPKPRGDPSMVFAFLALGRGVGNLVSGPLSGALVKDMAWKGEAYGGYGSGYGALIAFTGATAVCGGGSFLWKRLGWL
ncbi:MFS general substrate transporter [Podospora conica]|nr:MFS general substrate transporter [Schizothecium conicum]